MTRSPWIRRGALVLLALLGLLALAGPRAATWAFGYGPAEQHTAFPFAPPGFRNVPATSPAFDGDSDAWVLLAGDRGSLAWELEAGVPRSADLGQAAAAWRSLSLALSDAWAAGGSAGRVPVPVLAEALGRKDWTAHVLGMCTAGPDRPPRSGEGSATSSDNAVEFCDLGQVLAATRFLRLAPAHLMTMDRNSDGRVTRDEFRGAPRLAMHMLGTDGLGRDILVRLVDGLRMSLLVALVAALAASVIGIAWGATAAMVGGPIGTVMMRLVDVVYGLPFLFLAILLISLVGPSTFNLLVAIVAVQWLTMARTVRALVASLRTTPWAEASVVLGCGPVRLAVTHLLPNARRPILAWTALLVPATIKEEAFLSFLGLGVQAPRASLGTLIADGAPRLADAPWLVAAPALVLFLLVYLIHLAAE